MSVSAQSENKFSKYLPVAAGAGATVAVASPASATTTTQGISDLESAINDVGTVIPAVIALVVGAMGFRFTVKLINRMASKG